MRGKNGFGYNNIVRSCYLNILAVALDKGDVEAKSFNHTGVVRKAIVVGLTVGCLKQLDVESLWGLHEAIVATGDGFRGMR